MAVSSHIGAREQVIRVTQAIPLPRDTPPDVLSCALPTGFPFLVDDSSGEIVEPALWHLCDCHLRVADGWFSKNSTLARAYDLRDWWEYLQRFQIPWDDAHPSDLLLYRDLMISQPSPATGEPYSPITISRRVASVIEFYTRCINAKLVAPDVLEGVREVGNERDKAGSRRKAGASILPRPTNSSDEHVKVLKPKEAAAVLAALGPLPSEKQPDSPSSRPRLEAELALNTGLRLHEVAAQNVFPILALDCDPGEPARHVTLRTTVQKGGGTRSFAIPTWLVEELVLYIKGERQEILRLLPRGARRDASRSLFVNHATAGAHRGKPVQPYTIWRDFNQGVLKAGLVTYAPHVDSASEARPRERKPRFSFHDLRHTYAVWTYYARKLGGDPEPWLFIKTQLGHAHVATTMDIYLRVCNEFEALVSDRYIRSLSR